MQILFRHKPHIHISLSDMFPARQPPCEWTFQFYPEIFLLVLACPSSSFIMTSFSCVSIFLLYHVFHRLAIVRCCLNYSVLPYPVRSVYEFIRYFFYWDFTRFKCIITLNPLIHTAVSGYGQQSSLNWKQSFRNSTRIKATWLWRKIASKNS